MWQPLPESEKLLRQPQGEIVQHTSRVDAASKEAARNAGGHCTEDVKASVARDVYSPEWWSNLLQASAVEPEPAAPVQDDTNSGGYVDADIQALPMFDALPVYASESGRPPGRQLSPRHRGTLFTALCKDTLEKVCEMLERLTNTSTSLKLSTSWFVYKTARSSGRHPPVVTKARQKPRGQGPLHLSSGGQGSVWWSVVPP